MVCSILARKVLDQTWLKDKSEDLEVVWWIEKRLQTIQINGLVKLIKDSAGKKYSCEEMDNMLFRYEWAARASIDVINITNSKWFFNEIIQSFFNVDFSWSAWKDIVKVKNNQIDRSILEESIYIGINRIGSTVNLPYILGIFKSKKAELKIQSINIEQKIQSSVNQNQKIDNVIGPKTIDKWTKIEKLI